MVIVIGDGWFDERMVNDMKIMGRVGVVIGDILMVGVLFLCYGLWVSSVYACFTSGSRMPANDLLMVIVLVIVYRPDANIKVSAELALLT